MRSTELVRVMPQRELKIEERRRLKMSNFSEQCHLPPNHGNLFEKKVNPPEYNN